jgi:hypothetical protein
VFLSTLQQHLCSGPSLQCSSTRLCRRKVCGSAGKTSIHHREPLGALNPTPQRKHTTDSAICCQLAAASRHSLKRSPQQLQQLRLRQCLNTLSWQVIPGTTRAAMGSCLTLGLHLATCAGSCRDVCSWSLLTFVNCGHSATSSAIELLHMQKPDPLAAV